MQIYGPSSIHAPQSINAPHGTRSPAASNPVGETSPVRDELSLSPAAQFIEAANQLPDIRQDKVDSIRAALANGTYETADKLDAAVENLLNELG